VFGGDQASEELDGSQAGENKEAEFGGPINTIQEIDQRKNLAVSGVGGEEGADHGERSHGGEG